MRDAPNTPELLEISNRDRAPRIGTYKSRRCIRRYGMFCAMQGDGFIVVGSGSAEVTDKTAARRPWHRAAYRDAMASCRVPSSNTRARRSRIVRISAIDVRGMIDEGRCVSSAACAMDSRPTNEMMASEMPFIKLEGCRASRFASRVRASPDRTQTRNRKTESTFRSRRRHALTMP